MSSSPPAPSYRALLAVPGLGRLVGSALLSRTAAQMSSLILVLFVLDRFHSPQLSGITVMATIVPGLLVSPIAGAILDRRGRVPLIVLDYTVAGIALLLIAILAEAGLLRPWSLILIGAAQSLTMPLSNSGTRSLFPTIVPRPMWDRANAVDSGGYVVATVIGPGFAGAIIALLGSTWALAVPAGLSFAAGAMLLGMHVPITGTMASSSIWRDARGGLLYVLRNPALRALAVNLSIFNIATGGSTVALPVLVLTRLHGSSVEVGTLFTVMGLSGIVAGLLTGRLDSEGRERTMLAGSCMVTALAMLLLVFTSSMAMAVVAMALAGLANGPLDIALFSLRQRVTEPQWFGRAFAVSMSLNFAGVPLGSATTGLVVARSVGGAFVMCTVFAAAAALVPILMLPRVRRPTPATSGDGLGGASQPSHPR